MDIWIVAAAAGAGYVAQHLKNLTRCRHNWSDFSSKNLNFIRPESPRTIQKVQECFGEEICRQREQLCLDGLDVEMPSTSGFEGENLVMLDNFTSWCNDSNSNPLAGCLNNEHIQVDFEGRVPSDTDAVITTDLLSQPSSREIGFSYGFRRSKSSLRSRQINSKFIKPRNSLESCLMAQLYNERAEIEEYTYSVDPPQKPIVRPFVVTDGSRVIGRPPNRACSKPQENKNIHGVPRLPNVVPLELQTKAKAKNGNEQVLARSSIAKMAKGNQNNAQGSSNGALLFYLGLTMGIIYSFVGHEREIEKLRKLLKQSENLVQDLHEELEMKDALTVKELAVEDYESPNVHNDSHFDDALEQKLDSDHNADEESLRKIEAELEAELDRLESNMNSSKLEGKLSNVAEIDAADFVSDIVKGELRADLFGAKTGNQAYSDKDKSSSSTPRSVQYPVSPRELSLRLHEVIQSRLEERVKELETALYYSQRKIESMESQHLRSSNQSIDEPVVINLSGEALSAYNETYEEFLKLSESDEEESNHQEIFHPHKQVIDGGKMVSNDSMDESEDEMERLLIRQIVEKARQGSPAVLKAQRALLSIETNKEIEKLVCRN